MAETPDKTLESYRDRDASRALIEGALNNHDYTSAPKTRDERESIIAAKLQILKQNNEHGERCKEQSLNELLDNEEEHYKTLLETAITYDQINNWVEHCSVILDLKALLANSPEISLNGIQQKYISNALAYTIQIGEGWSRFTDPTQVLALATYIQSIAKNKP